MRARFIVEGFLQGLNRSAYHGFSSEFSDYRDYVAGDDPSYIDRYTMITINGADSFVNASTPGAVVTGTDGVTTSITNGYNTVRGLVTRYDAIAAGADGVVTFTVADNATRFYVNALMLRARANESGLPAVSFAHSTGTSREAARPA